MARKNHHFGPKVRRDVIAWLAPRVEASRLLKEVGEKVFKFTATTQDLSNAREAASFLGLRNLSESYKKLSYAQAYSMSKLRAEQLPETRNITRGRKSPAATFLTDTIPYEQLETRLFAMAGLQPSAAKSDLHVAAAEAIKKEKPAKRKRS